MPLCTGQAAEWKAATPKNRHFDPPITARGHRQATEAAEALKSMPHRISKIYVSPQIRCIETAAAVARELKMVGANLAVSASLHAPSGLGVGRLRWCCHRDCPIGL